MDYEMEKPSRKRMLRDMAVQHSNDINVGNVVQSNQGKQRSLLFLGSSGVGKSSLIMRFLERDDRVKPTLGLEYTYGRKARRSLVKDVCNIWEVDGIGPVHSMIAPLSLTVNHVETFTIVLMLDLSEPQRLWHTLETSICAMFNIVQHEAQVAKLRETVRKSLDDHPDFDSEMKMAVCRILRYVAHTFGATLFFYSLKEPGLVKKAKDLLNHHGFGTSPIKIISQDYNKPLIIPPGADSMQQIGGLGSIQMPPKDRKCSKIGPAAALEYWKHTFTAQLPQEAPERSSLPEDPSEDPNFCEPLIDSLKDQFRIEIDLLCKRMKNKSSEQNGLDIE